jgi:hypothetical protein
MLRILTTQLTNTSIEDAHKSWVKMEVLSNGSRVKLCGEDYLKADVGTIKAGATVRRQITLDSTCLEGLDISQVGTRFAFTIFSDERIQKFFYDYQQ